ncbi:hydantoinase/oxoprolinase family protein [Rhodococcus koreensis]|uniref:hydantoinase/oxoprolinase family protein n=1 Tax=Rhodococcus koreensis TaxID=99653 RepID=UPI00367095D8
MAHVAGIDVGGTFTDVLLYDEDRQGLRLAKVFSTTEMQADGLMNGLRQFDFPLDQLDALLHGTTVATNAVLERKGAKTALITTTGFRDVLEVRRRDRPHTYGLTGDYTPIVPRSRSFEIDERVDFAGNIVKELSSGELETLTEKLRAAEIESVAICLINSHKNSVHEQAIADHLAHEMPDVSVSASHQIAPTLGEFERASTTAINAFVRNLMTAYLGAVQSRMASAGFERDVLVMQSNGGVIPAARAGEYAVRTLLSGPAAGTVAAAAFGRAADLPNVISCDMGGTSFDVALIPGGVPSVTAESEVEYGLPLKIPMIDIKTIGAGGGSIAYIDRAGILRVGPESAGSLPGPVCYGRGGTKPTVSDANVVLGRIASDQKLGTQAGFSLDAAGAWEAIRREIAEPLEMTVPQAALAIIRIANEMMANAIRMVSVDKGHDPREFALVGFGGAGPLHIAELARAIGCRSVIIPPHPGALSAFGCLMGDVKYDFTTSVGVDVTAIDDTVIHEALAEHRNSGTQQLAAEGFPEDRRKVEHFAVLSYAQQMYTLDITLSGPVENWTPAALADAFVEKYAQTFGGRVREGAINLIELRSVATGHRPAVELRAAEPTERTETESRAITFEDGEHTVPVLWRDTFQPGQIITGPAVIHQTDTTTVLPPRSEAEVRSNGSLVVKVEA